MSRVHRGFCHFARCSETQRTVQYICLFLRPARSDKQCRVFLEGAAAPSRDTVHFPWMGRLLKPKKISLCPWTKPRLHPGTQSILSLDGAASVRRCLSPAQIRNVSFFKLDGAAVPSREKVHRPWTEPRIRPGTLCTVSLDRAAVPSRDNRALLALHGTGCGPHPFCKGCEPRILLPTRFVFTIRTTPHELFCQRLLTKS